MSRRKLAHPWSQYRCRCRKCDVNTIKRGEYYMLRDEVWNTAIDRGQIPRDKYGQAGMLCIGCVESLLGRQLTRQDFSDHWQKATNVDSLVPCEGNISDRLWDRLTSGGDT